MTEYTPTTDEVRTALIDRRDFLAQVAGYERPTDDESGRAFDRWLNEIRAEAWDEGHGFPCDKWILSEMCREYHPNPYRPNEK